MNLDGILGYFDEQRGYNVRLSALNQLIALTNNFRTVAFCVGQTKNTLRKLCFSLAEKNSIHL